MLRNCLLAAFPFFLLASFSSTAPGKLFLTGKNYASGELPSAAAVRDLNNDRLLDIVSANSNDANLSVFLGRADGTFNPAMTFAVGAGAVEVASADLDRDGKADLAVTDGIKSVYVVLGNGDGTFGLPTQFTLHTATIGVEIADLNADGSLDLAVANQGPPNNSRGEIAIMLGNGDGTFSSPIYQGLDHKPDRLVAVDLNQDGKLDLAAAVEHFATQKNSLAVLLGNGDGTFQSATTSIRGGASDVAAGDFNRDGKIDVALAGIFDDVVRVALGKGDGTFQSAVNSPEGGCAGTVEAADLDGNRKLDLLVGGGHVNLLSGRGDGTFSPAVTFGVGNRFATSGDFNGDGSKDVVAGGGFSAIGVALNNGRELRAPRVYFPPAGLSRLAAADFNSDGHADVAVGGGVMFGDGNGSLVPGPTFTTIATNWLRTGDFNRDGNPDLFMAALSGGVYSFLGRGDGTFDPALGPFLTGSDLWPELGDFNDDGVLDVAVVGAFKNRLWILLGNGDGTFTTAVEYPTGDVPQSPVASDFNRDGNLDLAVSITFGDRLAVYLGKGDGTFRPALLTLAPNALYSAAADFNGDGNSDLVLGGDGLNLYLGNGDGTFQPPQSVLSGYGPLSLGDIDGDGLLDVMVSEDFATLTVLRNKGTGRFAAPLTFPTGAQFVGHNLLADLDEDGRPEAIAEDIADSIAVLKNTSR
jgi:hypothetical protein